MNKNDVTYSYSCNNAKIVVDKYGFILKADGLLETMWANINIDKEIVGKHINELAKIMKEYANKDVYTSFLEGVILDFYENKEQLEKNLITKNEKQGPVKKLTSNKK